eukprot:TRINITY_DN19237_c0_g1_i1.p1 TRINITY_DN19237_c0_g1~~TRINITY_DN19237_c0_g1_i1.p1  ORF type:complete len:207 (-),score=39.80 TRINITY_DN19237_c0_g1_i1:103-723(-)
MIRQPPRSTLSSSSAASDVYKRQIYGGYGYATGGAGSVKSPLGAGLCAELSKQFMVGGTMGWLTYQNYQNQFFDPANAKQLAFIQKLSKARIAAKLWMVHGRATRSLPLNDSTGTLQAGCFLREKSSEAPSVVCAVALPTNSSTGVMYNLSMDPELYGLKLAAGSAVVVTDLMSGSVLGNFKSHVTYSASVVALDVQILKLSVQQS